MKTEFLNKNWKMRQCGDENWQLAVVPGTVYTDLLRNGNMENPFWRDNEQKAFDIMQNDFEYETSFNAEIPDENADVILLHFDGLDTIAEVFLNNQKLGDTENMHRVWEFDVTHLLKNGENTLRVYFHSPIKYAAEQFAISKTYGDEDAIDGFVNIRKAHCMYGWDWGAHLPDAGIFRPVSLVYVEKARFDDVYITQKHSQNNVLLTLNVETENVSILPKDEVKYTVVVVDPNGIKKEFDNSPCEINIENPMLWWANGLGKQYLYDVVITLFVNGKKVDEWSKKIGLRTLTVSIKKDEWGESFAHELNGIAIFAMGADYIPEDHLLGRVNPQTTRTLLEKAVFANFNTIRVWGGGYYPDDWFYEQCDEMGLIVWQDFMFACAVYDLTPQFEANIRAEFIDNVKRIRHHACLGLWCGNNEMEMFVSEGHHWMTKPKELRDYFVMYESIIPEILQKYDPETFYWPASPSSGGSLDNPNDPNRGDVHYWQVWHGNKPFSEYRKYFFRYASEFGFQSFPCKKTVDTFTDVKEDLNAFSYVMEKHQRNYGANGKIMNYLQQTFLYPTSFEGLLYASQLLQAEAIRYGVEHFRRNRGRCMGAIVWQLNDCWPVISWSSVDYTGRLKALHYYERRFFAPLVISCNEEGMMTQEADMNREHFEFEKSIQLCVSNETHDAQNVVAKWQLRNAAAEVLKSGENEICVNEFSSHWFEKIIFTDVDIFAEYVSYQLIKNGQEVSGGTVIFSYPKYFAYKNPELRCSLNGDEITVFANAYAKSVEVNNENEDLVLSDNYFDMNGGEKKIKVISGDATTLTLKSVFDIK